MQCFRPELPFVFKTFVYFEWPLKTGTTADVIYFYSEKTIWNRLALPQLWNRDPLKTPLLNDLDKNSVVDSETNNNTEQVNNANKKISDTNKETSKCKTDITNKAGDKKTEEKPEKPGVSLVKVIAMTFGLDYLIGLLWNLVNTSIHFFNPILLK